jgi:AbrB family looped-hinge helix DNA binding protein
MSTAIRREALVQLSPRGQVTLPIDIRRALGVKSGDAMVVSIEAGRIVLSPAVVTPVERFTDDRIAEFEQASQMTAQEVQAARKKWGV